MSPLEQWIVQWKPTDFSFTLFVFIILFAGIFILTRKILPYLIEKKWPSEQALREKRVQADIDIRRDELSETRLIRQALEKLNILTESSLTLLKQHDEKGSAGHENILAMIRIVLEKQGVPPSEIQAIMKESQDGKLTDVTIQRIVDALQKPSAN